MSNKNYVSNSPESVPMFKSGLLEKLSKVHFSVPLFLYIPVIAWCCWMALAEVKSGFLIWALTVLAGLFVWSFVEYVMHRFVFHFVPASKWGLRLHFIFHGVHHDYPNDALRLVLPPSVSIPLATGFYFLFKSFIPEVYFYGFFAGFIAGYLFYDISHYALHHFNFKARFWKKLKKHHMMHHYADANRGYGVSSSFWDKIFRSDFQK
ncbi:sterol desaturase family protein [Chitinophaga agri]|uniref:Fatty acid hydroxylase n=1 Tax=Chitinophaga agri TaxID=2703787 RepID=A0A6B9ZPQ2_9BACT|nr:sterol desaturase family protein [Chitinophaga agri]QHS63175.1 fatty acid hydroxylase [Chitinophaga agri]